MSRLQKLLAEQARNRDRQLLPFPWLVMTRPRARLLIERIDSLRRVIARLEDEKQELAEEIAQYRREAWPHDRTRS